MRKSSSRTSNRSSELLKVEGRNAFVKAYQSLETSIGRHKVLFRGEVFHSDCCPSFDHFQLKSLLKSDGARGFFYFEHLTNSNDIEVETPSYNLFTPQCDGQPNDRCAVFHYDSVLKR